MDLSTQERVVKEHYEEKEQRRSDAEVAAKMQVAINEEKKGDVLIQSPSDPTPPTRKLYKRERGGDLKSAINEKLLFNALLFLKDLDPGLLKELNSPNRNQRDRKVNVYQSFCR